MLLRRNAAVSRLVVGTTGDIEVHEWRFHTEVREIWKTYFLRRKAQLEGHRRIRAARAMLWGAPLGRMLAAYRSLDEHDRITVAATAQLTPRRITEMLRSPLALAEASLDEVTALSGALGLPSTVVQPGEAISALPARALAALQGASELQGWSGSETVALLRSATVELAKGGTRRLVFNTPADWIAFAGDGR